MYDVNKNNGIMLAPNEVENLMVIKNISLAFDEYSRARGYDHSITFITEGDDVDDSVTIMNTDKFEFDTWEQILSCVRISQ